MATIAITGANSGIGLRAAQQLEAQGHRVLALCRSMERAREALGEGAEVLETHMDDLESVAEAAEQVSAAGVDVLINNAAIFDLSMKNSKTSAQGHELVWATNHLGPTALAARLAPALAASADGRVVYVASKGLIAMPRISIRWDALSGQGWYTPTKAYYHSKLAQVMMAHTVAELAGGSVSVTCLRVPAVRLDAAKLAAQPPVQRFFYAPKNRAAAPAEAMGSVYATLATGSEVLDGVYVDQHLASCAPPRFARDHAHRARLRDVTEAAIGMPVWR